MLSKFHTISSWIFDRFSLFRNLLFYRSLVRSSFLQIRPTYNDGNPCKDETNILLLTTIGILETFSIGFIIICVFFCIGNMLVYTKSWCEQMWLKTKRENIARQQQDLEKNLEEPGSQNQGQELGQIS